MLENRAAPKYFGNCAIPTGVTIDYPPYPSAKVLMNIENNVGTPSEQNIIATVQRWYLRDVGCDGTPGYKKVDTAALPNKDMVSIDHTCRFAFSTKKKSFADIENARGVETYASLFPKHITFKGQPNRRQYNLR
jgi:hypothetical protein